ncbi:hypothetical protein ILUMI_21867 [Ignelater luminosus]|uniref:Uncharacterized protein n=1 Tax=Ignelater luminosus TaxID=2038154 RepID=A0A8K0CI53_IGNLU|nr:hypothetical protein ILUMI_21867 [Ignelater luminosus]
MKIERVVVTHKLILKTSSQGYTALLAKFLLFLYSERPPCCCDVTPQIVTPESESETTSSNILNNTLESCEEYLPTDEESGESVKFELENKKNDILKLRLERIEAKPKNYIGIPDHACFVIRLLKTASNLSIEDIYLTLEKLKQIQVLPFWAMNMVAAVLMLMMFSENQYP